MIQQWVEEHCLSVGHSHKTAKVIWQECVNHISESFGNNFSGLSREQVSKLVHNTRNRLLEQTLSQRLKGSMVAVNLMPFCSIVQCFQM
jgi:hypothetical protein